MRSRTRLAVATMVALAMVLPVAAFGSEAQDKEWTVLLYFGADNDAYQATYFCINQTLKGLEAGLADSGRLAVVVLFDGPEYEDTVVWELKYDGVSGLTDGDKVDLTDSILGGNRERDMTNPDTLVEFLTDTKSAYEADTTMLVLKNGHAWCGICPDETDKGSEKLLMPVDGIRDALSRVHASSGLWVDIVAFDGDNMGSIEIAYELRDVTSYMIGSQQQVPLEGLPYYLFMKDLALGVADSAPMGEVTAGEKLIDDYITYYDNTKIGGKKTQVYDKLLANSQMYVTAAMFEMGAGGEKVEAVVDAFNAYLNYMLHGTYPQELVDAAVEDELITLAELDAAHDQWMYPDADTGSWAWIPMNRNNIASARDCALIGKMNDQQGYEWLPDAFTWLWSMSALTNYLAYDVVEYEGGRPIEDVDQVPLDELVDPFVRLLLEDFMLKFGYWEPGVYRGVFDPGLIDERADGALVYLAQSQILDRSGNSFPHGLNIWFPPSSLQWDDAEEWSDVLIREMTYAYEGVGVWLSGEQILLPAEYYCIDSPVDYDDIGLDFTSATYTSWIEFFGVYYESRNLIYG